MIIVYDFDGTIADSLNAVITIYNRIAGEKGFKIVTKNNLEFLRAKNPKELAKELGVSLSQIPGLIKRGRKEFRQAVSGLKVQPGIKDALYDLKKLGHKQAILTTNAEENVKEFVQKNNLDIFDFIYGGSHVFGKARAFKKMMKNYRFLPQELIYIGDEVRDIEAARQAGVKIVSVSWGFNAKEALARNNPDALINKPEELLSAIQSL